MCTNSWSFQKREGLCPSHPLFLFLLAEIWEYWWKIEILCWWLLLLLLSRSVKSNSATSWTAACQASLSFTISQSLHKLMSIELMIPSNHLVLCCPLLLLPSIFPSIRVFSNKSALCIRWPKYWNFSINPPNEYWGLVSFRIYWFYFFGVKGLSRVFLSITIQSINSSVRSLPYCPTLTFIQDSWKNYSFDYMDLCQQSDISVFNTLSRFVKSFIPGNKLLLILWLQSPTTVILEPKKTKSVTISTFPPSMCHKVMGLDAMILDFWCWVLSQLFHPPLSPLWRGSLVSLRFLPLEWYHLYIWGC